MKNDRLLALAELIELLPDDEQKLEELLEQLDIEMEKRRKETIQ